MSLRFGLGLLLAVVSALSSQPATAASRPWQDKVDPWVLETAAEGDSEFLVVLVDQADLSPAAALETKLEKGAYVVEALRAHAERTQGPLYRALDRLGVAYRPYWVANMIWVRGDLATVQALAGRADVARVSANPAVRADLPAPAASRAPDAVNGIEWNITKVAAPDVWAAGFRGQGAVVAGQDTGYRWDHPALKRQYRGWDGSAASHDYNWHDAIRVSTQGSVCGGDSPFPCDDNGHGTHTMGTMVGDDGGSNQIGMAPEARWIGCRNMDAGVGTPASYSECYQWFIAPTRVDGSDPRPDLAPDVINNSWSCPASEGCTDPNVLLTVVQNVRAAGIVTVHSAGNSGSDCSTVSNPAATYGESFTVGATDSSDNIASFSSRGPVTVDGSNRMKPDVSAPGVGVRSSYKTGYSSLSGTSMAAPHVAGQVALLVSAYPSLAGNVDTIEDIVKGSAVPRTTTQGCGDDGRAEVPNNVYGWGRIDASAAYDAACRAPADAVTSVAIRRVDLTTVALDWLPVAGADRYEVWWAMNAPFFTPAPGGECAAAAHCELVADASFSQAALGDPGSNHSYVVLPAHSCGATSAVLSNRTGEFEYSVQPGAP